MSIEPTRHTIQVAGKERIFWAYLPEVPIRAAIVACHPSGGDGERFGEKCHLVEQAKMGVLAIMPNAGQRQWPLEGEGYEENRRFLHKLRLHALNMGASGVGLFGNSSGGWMTWKMRLDDPRREEGQFSWYAPGAANLPRGWAENMLAAPTWIAHGVNDELSPFEGEGDHLG